MTQRRDFFPVGVNAFVIREGKILLGERKDDWVGGGGWGLPGGHLEKGEQMKVRVAKELEEETGLCAQNFEFVALVNDYRDDKHYIQVGFLAKEVDEKEPELREPDRCFEWKWFSLNALPEHIFVGHRGLLQAFLNRATFID